MAENVTATAQKRAAIQRILVEWLLALFIVMRLVSLSQGWEGGPAPLGWNDINLSGASPPSQP